MSRMSTGKIKPSYKTQNFTTKHMIPPPEDTICNDWYAITLAPNDALQSYESNYRYQTFVQQIKKKLNSSGNHTYRIAASYSLVVEIAAGRLHLHGYVKIHNIIQYHMYDLVHLKKYFTIVIKQIDDADVWYKYCTKGKALMDIYKNEEMERVTHLYDLSDYENPIWIRPKTEKDELMADIYQITKSKLLSKNNNSYNKHDSASEGTEEDSDESDDEAPGFHCSECKCKSCLSPNSDDYSSIYFSHNNPSIFKNKNNKQFDEFQFYAEDGFEEED